MKSIKIKNFKAFRDEFDKLHEDEDKKKLILDKKNFLLYGDNGTGKSSLYEAIKLIFFKDRIEVNAQTPEGQKAGMEALWESYQNKQDMDNPFTIEINDTNYKDFDTSDYQTFMIAMDSFCMYDSIKLDALLSQFDFNMNIEDICENHYSQIEEQVNNVLKEFHEENIEIVIDKEEYYGIKAIDSNRGLETMDNLGKYFNEAKLNLIVLMLLFESIKISQLEEKKKILVLDDFITSLDISNRTFLMRYLFDNFSQFQILIFTHNVYFYNLIRYMINDKSLGSNWQIANLYEGENQHKLYTNPSNKIKKRLELDKLEKDLNSLSEETIDTLGNSFRQKFEILLYEFSKILMVGGVEESKNILDVLIKKEKLYFLKDGKSLKGSSELLKEIEKIIESGSQDITNIKNVLDKYSVNNFDEIQRTLQDLRLYQKVHMHHLSHGHIGDSVFSKKEAQETLLLLRKLESIIFNLMHQEMAGG